MDKLLENENVLSRLEYFIRIRKIPNIVFHGSSGSGKRTIVSDFINKIYNFDRPRIKNYVMFVNCAHGKGIKFIRDELKYFAKANMQCNDNNMFKSIVLMNADELTIDAQSALRRCIELFSHNTRFFIIVENKYKLLNPILSRFCEIYIPDKTTVTPTHQLKYTSMHQTGVETSYNMEAFGKANRCKIFDQDLKPIMLAFLEGATIEQIFKGDETSLSADKTPLPRWGKAEQEGCPLERGAEGLSAKSAILERGAEGHPLALDWFVSYANQLYESGMSCLDLIKYLEEDLGIETEAKKRMTITLNFCFNKIKGEYRCEKIALFYLFDYLFFRSNKSLKNISFI
jgi:hypothetical protein